jgi:hypothetical protein
MATRSSAYFCQPPDLKVGSNGDARQSNRTGVAVYSRGKLLRRGTNLALLACALIFLGLGQARIYTQTAHPIAKSAPQISPAAQDLLNHTVEALGGNAFLSFKTLTTQGRAFSISDGVTAGFVTYESAVEYPNKRRLSYGMGKSKAVTLINNGDHGWEIDQYGLIEQSQKRVWNWQIANRYSLENLLRVRVHEAGVLVLPAGQDFIDNLPTSILEIIDSRQVDVKLYVNTQDYLPIRITYRVHNPQSQDWDDYADVYSDYDQIDGIETPMHLVRYVNDERVAETFRTSAKYNQNYSAAFFEPGQ